MRKLDSTNWNIIIIIIIIVVVVVIRILKKNPEFYVLKKKLAQNCFCHTTDTPKWNRNDLNSFSTDDGKEIKLYLWVRTT